MFTWKKKISRYKYHSTQNSLKSWEMWFLAGVRMYVCVCVCACVRVCPIFKVSNPDNDNPRFPWQLMPDLWFYGILNFLKKGRGSSNFRKIRAIVLKLYINILYPSRNLGIEFGQNRLKHSNFFRFWIFWEFSQNCLTQANFDLSSWNFVRKCTNTEWCLILNFVKIGGDLNFRRIWFFYFFTVTSNFKNSMYPRSFVCEEAKIK